jgi:hypothetical protein
MNVHIVWLHWPEENRKVLWDVYKTEVLAVEEIKLSTPLLGNKCCFSREIVQVVSERLLNRV